MAEAADPVADLVSTIIPVFNRAVQLREAVASVLAQTYRPIEIIIVDDGSTDETATVCLELAAADPSTIRTVRITNGGPGSAREAGRLLARGELIQYLDSDDVLMPDKFTLQVAALRAHPDADVAYGRARFRQADGQLVDPLKATAQTFETMFPAMLRSRWWTTSCPLYRRRATDLAGPWLTLRLEEDWEYDCRIAAQGGRLVQVTELVCEQRDHPGPRLCRGRAGDAGRLAMRAETHAHIFAHARAAGLAAELPEMQHFARALFLLARQCGHAGLAEQSQALVGLARQVDKRTGPGGMQLATYEALAGLVGWRAMGTASAFVDDIRSFGR